MYQLITFPRLIAYEISKLFDCTALVVYVLATRKVYIVTNGTGDGCFAYELSNASRALKRARGAADRRKVTPIEYWDYSSYPYNAFCDLATPVESKAVARAVFRQEGLVICVKGSCKPVIEEATLIDENNRAELKKVRAELAAIGRPAEADLRRDGFNAVLDWYNATQARCSGLFFITQHSKSKSKSEVQAAKLALQDAEQDESKAKAAYDAALSALREKYTPKETP